MNHEQNKRQVPIFNRTTGESSMSEPIPVRPPRPNTEAEEPLNTSPEVAQSNGAVGADDQGTSHSPSGPSQVASAMAGVVDDQMETTRSEPGGKAKVDIETIEQFIEYAYSRKGQRVTLKAKTEKKIAQNPRLDDAAQSRLLAIATRDSLLAVPRQLLLLSRDIKGFPALRAALASFVSTVMFRHPVFADEGVQGALRNVPLAPSAAAALAKVVEFAPPQQDGKDSLKGAELQTLRSNAANLFATWLANNRNMNSEDLATLLFEVVWHPAGRELADDNARLRALTEVEQAAGVGLACLRFRQQASEARASQEQALREANDLRMRLAETEAKWQRTHDECEAVQAELEALRERTALEMTELRQQHDVERTHLRHDQEQLGGRLVRRLDEAVEMLDVGLSALRNKTPRVEVMVERAEHVVDALRSEIKNLREE
jgi:hypothetical protein